MKKIFLAAFMVVLGAAMAYAQPRAIGGRFGYNFDFSYQHSVGNNFVELDAGVECWGLEGAHAALLYEFVFAQPNWTPKGEWTWFAGVGVRGGFRWWDNHRVYHRDDRTNDLLWLSSGDLRYANTGHTNTWGATVGLVANIGLEYKFWFPLALAIDYRPYAGVVLGQYAGRYYHTRDDGVMTTNGIRFDLGAGDRYYNVFGDIALSVRYAF